MISFSSLLVVIIAASIYCHDHTTTTTGGVHCFQQPTSISVGRTRIFKSSSLFLKSSTTQLSSQLSPEPSSSVLRQQKQQQQQQQQSQTCSYSIHTVNSRERALDVLVFRHGKLFLSVEEYEIKHPNTPSREEALRQVTSSYDDHGKDLLNQQVAGGGGDGDGEELVQFYALVDSNRHPPEEEYCNNSDRTHGVIGSIDGHRKKRRFSKNNGIGGGIEIELKNLRVHDAFRRQGIGKALVQAIQQYGRDQLQLLPLKETTTTSSSSSSSNDDDDEDKNNRIDKEVVVFLQFDSTNHGAIRLYEDCGFVIDDSRDPNRMNWYCTTP
jgi:ribosomal protein S18 acetylase RimI-like enzyme